ncbi:11423_t:CDS:2 [Scutellospora calospora]|uniref:11423_t:CDS:1 n=1 Tax=Scutellospora calospora TaxID=85575 RepID=A0ACA9JZD1_9GLOM|nr:11423_t:CDS:2 [Scutellospora calospora]
MPNWPAPSPEIQHLLRILPSQCSGHPLGPLWQAFNPIKVDKKTKATCIFCKHENPISGTAAVMGAHIKKCTKIPLNVQIYLINAQEFQNQQNNIQKSLEFSRSSSDISIDSTSITPISSQDLIVTMSNNNQFLLDSYKSNQLLLEGMIEGGVPLSLVDALKFKEFIYSINSQYHLPARRQLSSHILDNVYDNVQLSIQEFINKSDWITIATDGWTNIRQDHLINYIVIGKNRKSELIKVKDTHGESQTSETILHDLVEVMTELGIEKISTIITDEAANYIRMKTILVQQYPKILALPCVAHESNLLVGDMLKHTYMKSTITLALKIITYLRKSIQAIQFIRDRACNNTFREIISILKNDTFWSQLEMIIQILELYSLVPIILESQYATIADAVYLWCRMQKISYTIYDNFQNYIISRIKYRWQRIYNPVFLISWLLHPKYFLAKVIHPELLTFVKKEASTLFSRLFPDKDI